MNDEDQDYLVPTPKVQTISKVALILGLIPFFFAYGHSESTSISVDGETVGGSHFEIDYVKALLGPLVILLALMALPAARKAPASARTTQLVAAAIALCLGAYHAFVGLRYAF